VVLVYTEVPIAKSDRQFRWPAGQAAVRCTIGKTRMRFAAFLDHGQESRSGGGIRYFYTPTQRLARDV